MAASTDTRSKFRELTRVFDPIYRTYQDAGDGPGASYVPEAHQEYRKQLEAALDLNDSVKLLVAGQPGCGKTTLLLSMAHSLRAEGRIVAFVDLEAHTAVQDLGSVEMHMAAIVELLLAAKAANAALSADTLNACVAWILQLQSEAPPAEPEALAVSFRRQLAVLRDNRTLRDQIRMVVKEARFDEPFRLLTSVLTDLEPLRPAVIIDGLDKLPPQRARDTFLDDKRKPMAEVPGTAIVTIPLTIVYETAYNILGGRYLNADNAVLPAVRLWDFHPVTRTRTRSEKGLSILRSIIDARIRPIDPDILMPQAIERAIEGSGGNIRELARLIQSSVVKAHVRHGDFVERQDVEAAIADQRESFRRGYNSRFFPILKKVSDEFILDDTGEDSKLLLYGLWVIEYRNGTAWYSLPEPVEQLLQHLERSRK